MCSSAVSTIKLAGYLGKIQWQYSVNGEDFYDAPYKKSGNIINNFGATTFTTTTSTGVTPTYLVTNLIADTYFRAKITNGACYEVYTDAVLFKNGTLAIGGTISSDTSSICSGSATTLTLVGSVGTIVWQKSSNYFTNPSAATWLILTDTATDISTGNLNSSTAYRAKVTIGSCSTVDSENVFTVTVNKAVAKAITSSTTSPTGKTSKTQLCSDFSTPKLLTIGTGYSGDITWQHSIDNKNWTTIDNADSDSYIVDVASTGVNYYRVKFSTSTCSPDAYSKAVTIFYKSCSGRMGSLEITQEAQALAKSTLSVVAYPNPSSTVFTLQVLSSNKAKSSEVRVYDILGRLIEKRLLQQAKPIEVGASYPSGIYNIIVTQDTEVKSLRVIKK